LSYIEYINGISELLLIMGIMYMNVLNGEESIEIHVTCFLHKDHQ